MDKPIIKEFEGNKIATLVWNDRVCWIANNIASALDYADPSTTVGQCIKGEDFKAGIEYQVLKGKALKEFKNMVNSVTEEISVSQNTPNLTIFYEEGLFGFTVWAHKPTGIRLRKWISMLEFIPPDDLKKINRQIKALQAVISKDAPKDKIIHQMALNKLIEQRNRLLNK